MNCALRNRVNTFFVILFACTQSVPAFSKDGKFLKNNDPEVVKPVITTAVNQFQWSEHNQLSWDDFRGDVHAANGESAAATHCGIGFRTQNGQGNKMEIIVYNTFYTERSWVKKDAKLPSILAHEQGHFDLCEVYTRKLRARLNNCHFNATDLKKVLMNIYTDLSAEYESRQQLYEQETIHGTDLAQQQKWQAMIKQELF